MSLNNKEQLKVIKDKPNITYKNLLLLGLSFGGIVFFFQQLLLDLNIKFLHFRVGNLDLLVIIGFALSVYGAYSAFQKTIKSQEKEEESLQYGYVLRELDQAMQGFREAEKELLGMINAISNNTAQQGIKQGERIGDIEQKVYANHLLFEHHEKERFHIGAQQQLAILEGKLTNLEVTLSILSRQDEYALRIARLEEELRIARDNKDIKRDS